MSRQHENTTVVCTKVRLISPIDVSWQKHISPNTTHMNGQFHVVSESVANSLFFFCLLFHSPLQHHCSLTLARQSICNKSFASSNFNLDEIKIHPLVRQDECRGEQVCVNVLKILQYRICLGEILPLHCSHRESQRRRRKIKPLDANQHV